MISPEISFSLLIFLLIRLNELMKALHLFIRFLTSCATNLSFLEKLWVEKYTSVVCVHSEKRRRTETSQFSLREEVAQEVRKSSFKVIYSKKRMVFTINASRISSTINYSTNLAQNFIRRTQRLRRSFLLLIDSPKKVCAPTSNKDFNYFRWNFHIRHLCIYRSDLESCLSNESDPYACF